MITAVTLNESINMKIVTTRKDYREHWKFSYINQNCTATNKPSYVRIHKHKYKNLELFDQKKTNEIFDSRRRRNISKNNYKLFLQYLRIFPGDS
jgi:hypothetical protein